MEFNLENIKEIRESMRREAISKNNGMKLSKETTQSRFKDWEEADKTNSRWRYILAEKWGVSYTQVGRLDRKWIKRLDPDRAGKFERPKFYGNARYPGQHRAPHLQRKRKNKRNDF